MGAEAFHTRVMGILNVTPDSFSDGGKYNTLDAALFHAERMQLDGADVVDVGGESTRPGYTPVSAEEETERVLPVIEAIKARLSVPVSLDTCKAEVAEAGLRAGADVINDIHGLRTGEAAAASAIAFSAATEDKKPPVSEMARVLAAYDAPCVLMHFREKSGYADLLRDVADDLRETLAVADAAGIRRERILLDPGIGFGKTRKENLALLRGLQSFHALGCPLLLGSSRKSVIGLTLKLPENERLEGTLATTAAAVYARFSYVRVHDVKENVRFIRMLEEILYG